MIELSIRFKNTFFSSYAFKSTVIARSAISERRLRKGNLLDAIGVHEYELRTPSADLDLMLELSMRKYSTQHYEAIDGHLDHIDLNCIIDVGDGDSQENVSLSALLAWMNHFSLDDDSLRESVVDLRLVEQRWLLSCLEHGIMNAETFAKAVEALLYSPDAAMVELASKFL